VRRCRLMPHAYASVLESISQKEMKT